MICYDMHFQKNAILKTVFDNNKLNLNIVFIYFFLFSVLFKLLSMFKYIIQKNNNRKKNKM